MLEVLKQFFAKSSGLCFFRHSSRQAPVFLMCPFPRIGEASTRLCCYMAYIGPGDF